MSEKYVGSNLSNDPREVKDLVPKKPVPPGFSSREEFEGFQHTITSARSSGLIPKSYDTNEKAIIGALKGRELGLEPLYALSVIYIVNGVPALEGEVMLALVLKRYPKAQIKWIEATEKVAVVEMGREGGPLSRFTFTIEEAMRAGIIVKINENGTVVAARGKEVWEKYTADMLVWRTVARAVRRMFPECIMGCLTPDEASSPEPVEIKVTARELDDAFKQPEVKTIESPKIETVWQPETKAIETEPLTSRMAPSHQEMVDHAILESAKEESKPTLPESELFDWEKKKIIKDGSYMIRFGSLMGKRLDELHENELRSYLLQLKKQNEKMNGKDVQVSELIKKISDFLS